MQRGDRRRRPRGRCAEAGQSTRAARSTPKLLAAHAGRRRPRPAGRARRRRGDEFFDALRASSIDAPRAQRIPLQHLTGTAAFGPVTVARRPGCVHPAAGDRGLLEWASAQPLPHDAR